VIFSVLLGLIVSGTAPAEEPVSYLIHEQLGVPMRVRDFTVPSFLVLGFTAAPAAPLGKNRSAFELHYSKVNDFQVSPAVEEYLERTRGGSRRRLTEDDVDFIVSLPDGEGYYIDGEFDFIEAVAHWGLTDRLDLSLAVPYIRYTGGTLDSAIFNFHDLIGAGQQGRNLVEDDQFQFVTGANGVVGAVSFERPSRGGFGDPNLYLRYVVPGNPRGWRFNLAAGIKPPIASTEKLLSTGSWDFGMLLTADKRWQHDALIFNLGLVAPGEYKETHIGRSFDPPMLPSLNLSWLHRCRRWTNTRVFLQLLAARHIYSRQTDSDIADPEFQMTVGMKWVTRMGVLGVGLTENLLNFDNTPDIGIHLSWGLLLERRGRRGSF
jgi:hypothetical protein